MRDLEGRRGTRCSLSSGVLWMSLVAYLGGAFGSWPPLATKFFFTMGKIWKTYFGPPLCEH